MFQVTLNQSGNTFTGTLSKGAKSGNITVEFTDSNLVEVSPKTNFLNPINPYFNLV